MNKLRTAALLLTPCLLWGQPPKEQRDTITLPYEIKTQDLDRARAIHGLVQELMPNTRLSIVWNAPMGLFVLSGPPDVVDRALALLKKYDVPARHVEFTAYLISARKAAAPQAGRGMPGRGGNLETSPTPIPQVLTPAIEEMKRTFNYERFSLLDVNTTQTSGHAEFEGLLDGAVRSTYYRLSYGGLSISADGKTITVPHFEFKLTYRSGMDGVLKSLRGGPATEAPSTGIENEIVIHEGERLVLGRMHFNGSDPSDLFLILTAKVLPVP